MLPRCKHTGEVLEETNWPGWAKRRGTKVSRSYDRKRRLLSDNARVTVMGVRVRPSDPRHPLHSVFMSCGYNAVYKELRRSLPSVQVDEKLSKVRRDHALELDRVEQYHTNVKEGYVYAISNRAWPHHVKIGSAIDPESRLATFQTADPYRGYELRAVVYSKDRKALESAVHSGWAKRRLSGTEWFVCTNAAAALKAIQYYSELL